MIWLCALVLVLSLLLGGGTRSGFLADAVIQVSALPLLVVAGHRLLAGRRSLAGISPDAMSTTRRSELWRLVLGLAIFALPLVQLIPLPPQVWSMLPGRSEVAAAFETVGHDLPWKPLSVSPHATMLAALSMLPPIALFWGMTALGYQARRQLSLLLLAVGIASVFLGLLQVAQGEQSPLRFFEFTNPTEAVGFFANRNHFAALLYVTLVIAAAWAIEAVRASGTRTGHARFETANIVSLLAGFTGLVIIIAAQTMTRSRAGLGLTLIALVGCFAMALAHRHQSAVLSPMRLIASAVGLALVFGVQFALYRVLERFTGDPLEDARIPFARNTWEAAKSFMPFGSGAGSFIPVYGLFEKPKDTFAAFANRAHNDVLEFWLENGVPGLVLAAMIGAWIIVRSYHVWSRTLPHARPVDQTLARAATLVVALLLAHSFADYPLRTGALAAVMAFALGLLVPAPAQASEEKDQSVSAEPALIRRSAAIKEAVRAKEREPSSEPPLLWPSEPSQSKPTVRGLPGGKASSSSDDIVWPAAWREPVRTTSRPDQGEATSKSETKREPDEDGKL